MSWSDCTCHFALAFIAPYVVVHNNHRIFPQLAHFLGGITYTSRSAVPFYREADLMSSIESCNLNRDADGMWMWMPIGKHIEQSILICSNVLSSF